MKTLANVAVGMGSRNKLIIMRNLIQNHTNDIAERREIEGGDEKIPIKEMRKVLVRQGEDDVKILNPRLARIENELLRSDPHDFAILQLKKLKKQEIAREKKKCRSANKRIVNDVRKQARAFSFFPPEMMEAVEDGVEEIREKFKFLHADLVAATSRGKKAKRKRKHLRRAMLDIHTEAYGQFRVEEGSVDQEEFHAEFFRYMGQIVPPQLIQFYNQKSYLNKIIRFVFSTYSFVCLVRSIKGDYDKHALARLYVQAALPVDVFSKFAISMLLPHVIHVFEAAKEDVQTESSFADGIDYVSQLFASVNESQVVTSLKTLLYAVASAHLFPKEVAVNVFKYCGNMPNMTGTDMVTQVLGALASLVRMAEALINGTPISRFLFEKSPVDTALKRAIYLSGMSTSLYDGVREDGKLDMYTFIRELDEILPLLRNAIEKMNPFTKNFATISSLIAKLTPEHEGLKSMVRGQSRRAPIGVIIHGPPGVGKSNWLSFAARIYSDVCGRTFNQTDIYERVLTSDYWEGYDPHKHRAVHYSELGSDQPAIVKTKGDKNISELTTVLDSVPLSLDMAFGGKAKTYFSSDLVLIDTNYPDLNLKHFKRNTSAYQRRFIYIEPTVLKEHRKDNGCGIDPSKNGDKRFMDKYEVNIYIYEQLDNSRSAKKVLASGVDIDGAADLLYALFAHHIREQNTMRAMKEKDKETAYGSAKTLLFDEDGRPYHPYIPVREINVNELLGRSGDDDEKWVIDEKPIQKDQEDQDEGDYLDDDDVRLDDINGDQIQDDFWCGKKMEEYFSGHVPAGKNIDYEEKGPAPPEDVSSENFLVNAAGVMSRYELFAKRSWSHMGRVNSCLYDVAVDTLIHYPFLVFLLTIFKYFLLTMGLFSLLFLSWRLGFLVVCGMTLLYLTPIGTLARLHRDDYDPKAALSDSVSRFKAFLTGDLANLYGSMMVGVLVALIAAWKIYRTTAAIVRGVEGESDDRKVDIEEQIGARPALTRTKGSIPDAWIVQHNIAPLTHTGTASSLDASIQSNVRLVCVVAGTTSAWTTVFGIYADYALINAHCIPVGDFTIRVSRTGDRQHGAFSDTIVRKSELVVVTQDLYKVRLNQMQFKDVRKHFSSVDFKIAKGSISCDATTISVQPEVVAQNRAGDVIVKNAYRYSWKGRGPGRCGTPLCAQIGARACIVGIHFAGSESAMLGFAVPVTIDMLGDKICSEFMEIISLSDEKESLAEPHKRSPFRFRNLHHVDYMGSDGSVVTMNDNSCIERNPNADEFIRILGEVGIEKTAEFLPPLLKRDAKTGADPIANNLLKLSSYRKPLDREKLGKCVSYLVDRFGELDFAPLTFQEAVNGSENDDYLRRINVSTGSGYGFVGKKDKYLPILSGNERVMTDKLEEKVDDIIKVFLRGQTNGTIFGAKLKDEPRLAEKVKKGSTRMFYPVPLPSLIVSRIVLGPFFSHIVCNRDILRSAVGINMYTEAPCLYDSLMKVVYTGNVEDEIAFEGDYGGFDTSMPYEIGLAASSVICSVCERAGYNEDAMKILRGVLTDNLFPFVEVKGDIFRVPGLMTSGSYGTAEFNCIRNVLLMLYYFETTEGLEMSDLFHKTQFVVYGDDVLATVKREIAPLFNCVLYSRFCKDVYGMDFTSSSKGAVVTEFVPMRDMQFLKRTFVFNKDFDKICAVLDYNSIVRMLEWTAPSGTVSAEDQLVATMQSSLYEIAQARGRDGFEHCRERYFQFCEEHFQLRVDLPTWSNVHRVICPEAIVLMEEEERREELSLGVVLAESRSLPTEECTRFLESVAGLNSPSYHKRIQCPQKNTPIYILMDSYKDNVYKLEKLVDQFRKEFGDIEPEYLVKTPSYRASTTYRSRVNVYRNLKSELVSSLSSIEFLRRKSLAKLKDDILTEADEVSMKNEVPDEVTRENLIDTSGCCFIERSAGIPHDPMSGKDLSLDNFFNRPIQLDAVRIEPDLVVNYSIDVWETYTNNPAVRAKLRNNAFARFDLEVSIAFTGTPFHAGRYLISYQPYAQYNHGLAQLLSHNHALYTYLSQAPGAVCMDVKNNQPVIMTIPYLSPQPVARLFNNATTVLSGVTPFDDFKDMGTLFVVPITPVTTVSVGASDVFFYIYCRAVNVTLHTPTGTLMDIVTEADERVRGPIERYSSVAASVMKMLRVIPNISLFAYASEIGLNAVSNMASLFGWSYPTLIAHPTRIRPDPWQNGAQTIGIDTGKRITLDPKQEIPLATPMFGSAEDELVISKIAGIETWLDTFEWTAENVSMTDVLYRIKVSPNVKVPQAGFYSPTALSFAATPFKCWRGTIVIRCDIVTTAFHRGKIMLVYEPNVVQSDLITVDTELNKQYMRIVDLQETQSVVMEIGWNYPRPWAKNMSLSQSVIACGNTFLPSSTDFSTCNGMVYIVPLTQLQSPDSSSVKINVFVSGKDMMFNRFSSDHMPTDFDLPDVKTEADQGLETGTPVVVNIGGDMLRSEDASKLSFGEQPFSFRSLLKRFSFGSSSSFDATGNTNVCVRMTMPVTPGYFQDYTNGGEKCNLYTYLRTSFLAQRGALRHRVRSNIFLDGLNISLAKDTNTDVSSGAVLTDQFPRPVVDGSVMYLRSVNSGIEFEIPFYTNNVWIFAFNRDPYAAPIMQAYALRQFYIDIEAGAPETVLVEDYIATGEDFSFHRFVGAAPFSA